VYDTVFYVTLNIGKALTVVLQRDSYLYWPFIVSSVIIAALAWRWTVYARSSREKRSWRQFFLDYFGAHIWWHRSARADYALYFANALLVPLAFGYLLASEKQIAVWIDAAIGNPQGAGDGSGVLVRVLFTIVFFIAYDFGRFVAQRNDPRIMQFALKFEF